MQQFIILTHEVTADRTLAYLLYSKSRIQAIREVKEHCREKGFKIDRVYSHDVTIDTNGLRRIDHLFPSL